MGLACSKPFEGSKEDEMIVEGVGKHWKRSDEAKGTSIAAGLQ